MKKYQLAIAVLITGFLGTSVVRAEMNGNQPETPANSPVPVAGTNKTDVRGVPKLEVEFQSGQADIPPSFNSSLNAFGQYLKQNPTAKADIIAYADHTGAAPNNAVLSQKRADAVQAYLVSNFAISSDRITAKGAGEVTTKSQNSTENAKQANRRAFGTISKTS